MIDMAKNINTFTGLRVYTNKGIYIGRVEQIMLDIQNKSIHGLFITNTNPNLIEGSKDIIVPYRWVAAVNDILLLRYFPETVSQI